MAISFINSRLSVSLVRNIAQPEPVGQFDPSQYTLWLDADDLSSFTLTGSLVDNWANKGTGGTDFDMKETGANRPSRVLSAHNGGAAVRFDGSTFLQADITDYLDAATSVGTTLVVVKRDTGGGSNQIIIGNNSSAGWELRYAGSATSVGYLHRGVLAGTPETVVDQLNVIGFRRDQNLSEVITNDTIHTQEDLTGYNVSGLKLKLGFRSPSSDILVGDICEIISDPTLWSNQLVSDGVSYLKTRWGIS